MSWTPEREKKLRELWKIGHTASQIASLLGNTTRNAVIGKAHRLNLEARAVSKKSTLKVNKESNVKTEIKTQKLGRKAKFKALLSKYKNCFSLVTVLMLAFIFFNFSYFLRIVL